MHTPNKADVHFQKLSELFPNAVTETITGYDENGKAIIERAIDKDILMQEISTTVIEGYEERYQFTWPDKKKAILLANAPIVKTLRPCKEESVNFDNTENLYIEGDNLDVLKLLQETYLGKIKMIYIDPPYNTGNDFVYDDDYAQDTDEYLANSGQYDEEGKRLVKNLDSNGRFHTDWLNMIYPRLKLAKDLLSDNGVIFISIDDNEVENLLKICNDVFGESNKICNFIWKSKLGKVGTTSTISSTHEYIVCYAKNMSNVSFKMIEKQTEGRKESLRQWGQADRREDRPSMWYPITINDITVYPIKEDGTEGRWRVGQEMCKELLKAGCLEVTERNGKYNVYRNFPTDISVTPYDTLLLDEIGTTAKGAITLKNMDMRKVFDYSKPVELIRFFAHLCTSKEDIILDFFSGSATTAHSVMQLNAEDGGNRKFIMVQLLEKTDEKSEAYKAGYKNICEIGKERIRRTGAKNVENITFSGGGTDTGFRVLKLDTSNMKDVYYNPEEYNYSMFDELIDNIKEDRTPEDLLFQVMLDLGVLLSSKIEESTITGKKVFNVAEGFLIACFDENVTEETIKAIAQQKPYYFVIRDSSMVNDSVATNFEQIFSTYSPDTVRKVL
ncbi:MAG TPA: site-specific DNA-methyltransferase [Clostridiales bacterium]|nr:site-specific DNA-methyltransferase [Clostridiales bacterium]